MEAKALLRQALPGAGHRLRDRENVVRRSQGSDENQLPQLLTRTGLFGSGLILRPVRFMRGQMRLCARVSAAKFT